MNKNEEISAEKVGLFLKQLRKEHKVSQQQLADELYITRQAVSLWEVGKTLPDYDSALLVANYFNISIADLFAGKYLENDEEKNTFFNKVIKREVKRSKMIILGFILLIIILLFAFLTYYFINNYNSIKVYKISYANELFKAKGILTKSVNKIYLNIGIDSEPKNICLKYKNETEDRNLMCKEHATFIVLKEELGYSDVLKNNSFDDLVNNLYFRVDDNDYKLFIEKDYQNSDLFFNSEDNIISDKYTDDINLDVPKKIKENFKYNEEENKYYLEYKKNDNKIILEYFKEFNIFIIKEFSNDTYTEFSYNISIKEVVSFFQKNLVTKEYKYSLENFPNMNNNAELKQIFDYYKETYLVKYIY